MYGHKIAQSPFLLFLLVGLPLIRTEEFPQCVNVQQDSFIMAIDDCKSYIYCNGESSFRDSCPDQTYFDAAAQECAFDDEGICLQRVDTSTTLETLAIAAAAISEDDQEEIVVAAITTASPTQDKPAAVGSRPHCDTVGDGNYPHAQRCEYYYSCSSGYLTIVRCPYKFGWDYAERQCRVLSEARCLGL